ncbi:hypothetical protein LXL04_028121 [Taraxacum kok-saghyz]
MSSDNHVVEPGKLVEVITVQPRRVTSYYPATCLEIRGEKCRVKHQSKKDDNGFELIEDVPLDMVRPEPSSRQFSQFVVGDIVDCKHDGGWWKCKVNMESSHGKLRVTFEYPALGGYFHKWMTHGSLRLHQEWNHHNPDCKHDGGWWKCKVNMESSHGKLRVTFEYPALGGYFHRWMTRGSLRPFSFIVFDIYTYPKESEWWIQRKAILLSSFTSEWNDSSPFSKLLC